MSTFVLIHGAWHGGWAWQKVVAKLEALGHTVVAPDLPGHGDDKTPVQQVTLDSYAQRIVDVMDRCAERVVLVGHSMGGIAISAAAERRPERVKVLVYVCAFLLRNGQKLVEFAATDTEALVMPNAMLSQDGHSATLRPEVLREAFYADCSEEDYQFAISRLVPQSTALFGAPITVSDEKFGRIPRVYLECTQDRAITLPFQRKMQAQVECDQVFSLHCSHSPFFSTVNELVNCLVAASACDSIRRLTDKSGVARSGY
jgi:pimeloyl-ACP methyl ester carboxylesterase